MTNKAYPANYLYWLLTGKEHPGNFGFDFAYMLKDFQDETERLKKIIGWRELFPALKPKGQWKDSDERTQADEEDKIVEENEKIQLNN